MTFLIAVIINMLNSCNALDSLDLVKKTDLCDWKSRLFTKEKEKKLYFIVLKVY